MPAPQSTGSGPETVPGDAEEPQERQERPERPERQEPERDAPPRPPSVSEAIEQDTGVIEELKQVLGEMEEVLETLELAERQKIDDEREIEWLQRALRQLHRPSHGDGQRGR